MKLKSLSILTACLLLFVCKGVKEQRFELPFSIDAPDSVPFKLFSVTSPGSIQIEVEWKGRSEILEVVLSGRRRPELKDPTEPYASAEGPSPLSLSYEVTDEDLTRGVGWRVSIIDTEKAGVAEGIIKIKVPFNEKIRSLFKQEKVALRSGDLWPTSALTKKFLGDLSSSGREGLHGIISLNRALSCVEAQQLKKLGIIRQSFLPGRHSFGFVRKGTDFNHPLIRGAVRSITPLQPEDKVNPHILVGNYHNFLIIPENEPPINYVLNKDGTLELSILFAKDVSLDQIKNILTAEAVSSNPITDNLWRNTLSPAKLLIMASKEEVEWIDAGPEPFLPLNDNTRQNIQVDTVQNGVINPVTGTITYNGLSGQGVTVGVADNGIDATHTDLNVVVDLAGGAAHGTHVAGIIAASGFQSDKNATNGNPNGGTLFQWRGMAPNAAIIDSYDLVSAAAVWAAIQNNSMDLANHSHTLGVDGNYGGSNQTMDQEIQGSATSNGNILPPRIHVCASANNGAGAQYGNVVGYFSLLNQTKNSLLVGNWRASNNTLSRGSSMGPAHDGRIKPDVVAPGTGIKSTGTGENEIQLIEFVNGTPTMGTFTLTYSGQTTAAIPFNASSADVQTELEALANINAGDINTSGGNLPGNPVLVEFIGFPLTDVPLMTSADTGLDAGNTFIRTPRGGHDDRNGYVYKSGTSMASPATAGVVALLLEGWQDTYNTPIGATLDANPPLPSTLKALIIQTAEDIINNNVRGAGDTCADVDSDSDQTNGNDGIGQVTATAGPDFATGWGRVNAQAAVDLLQDCRTVNNRPFPNRIIQDTVNQGGIVEYDFVVDQPGPLRITLAWDDVEAALQNPATNRLLVNDLDLELVDPNGTIFYPWQLGQTIQDLNGNTLANNAQPPGTNIQVIIPIIPEANPADNEYVPANALTGNGDWVATQGKDHLNNVEQVFVQNVQANQIGHWKVRVLGFDIPDGAQRYSVVGFPYPDLAELVVSCTAKVGLTLNSPMNFTWTVDNIGDAASGGVGDTFNYRVWLSEDFYLDSTDVLLTDSNQAALGPLAIGAFVQHNSSVTITQANADNLLGPGTTVADLIDNDVFLLVQADSDDDVLEHNETNIAFVQLARLVDVVLVMDRSGSMSGEVPVSNGTQEKIDILKDSANLFLDLMRLDAGDELAEVSFSGSQGAASITTDFGPAGLTAITSGNIGQARAAVNALAPGLSTDIRGGLQRGLDVLTAGTSIGHRRVLIFFSDGKKTAGGDPTEAAFLQQFDTHDVHVYSVGFGTVGGTAYTGIDVDLLNDLTNANPGTGFFHVTESAVALDKFFVNAVAGAIDAQVVVDPESDIPAKQYHTTQLLLNQQDYVVTFILTWDNPNLNLDLAVRTPSGYELNLTNSGFYGNSISITQAPAYKLMSIKLPIQTGLSIDHDGRWEMIIKNPGNIAVHYSASVISETTIRAGIQPPIPKSGKYFMTSETIPLVSTISQLGNTPIAGATVSIMANVPLVSLGNLLASASISSSELASIPKEIKGDPLSQQERLFLALKRRTKGKDLLPRADLKPFQLKEKGEQDGYAGSFDHTRIEGFYHFVARYEGLTDDCQPYQRETSQTVFVGPNIDPQTSPMVVTPSDPGTPGGITVTVTPRTNGGNFIGPGLADRIMIKAEGLNVKTEIKDLLNGSYSQTFQTGESDEISILVSVLGINFNELKIDTKLPLPVSIQPKAVKNDSDQKIEVQFDPKADIDKITSIVLIAGNRIISLDNLTVDKETGKIQTQIPAGLEPGLYFVCFESPKGRGLTSRGITFRIIGADAESFPSNITSLKNSIEILLKATSNTEGLIHLGDLLRDIHNLPIGPNLTMKRKTEAINQVISLLDSGYGQIKKEDIPDVISILEYSKKDSSDYSKSP